LMGVRGWALLSASQQQQPVHDRGVLWTPETSLRDSENTPAIVNRGETVGVGFLASVNRGETGGAGQPGDGELR
jgi:hypothetical protein